MSSVAETISAAATDREFDKRYPDARDWAIANFERKQLWQSYLSFYLRNRDDHVNDKRRAEK